MRKLPQNIYFKPYFCLPDTFLAEKLNLRAFTASRKTSHKFSEAGRFEQKKWLGGLISTVSMQAQNMFFCVLVRTCFVRRVLRYDLDDCVKAYAHAQLPPLI